MIKLGRLALGFFLGAVTSALVIAGIDVYLLGNFDPKFAGVPNEAFKLAAVGALLLALFGAVVLMAAALVQHFVRSHSASSPRHPLLLGVVAGGIYSLVPWAIHTALGATLQPESVALPVVVWLFLAVYPVALVLATRPFASSQS